MLLLAFSLVQHLQHEAMLGFPLPARGCDVQTLLVSVVLSVSTMPRYPVYCPASIDTFGLCRFSERYN